MFDLVIRGGEVIDGTGAMRRRLDVGVIGDRIVELGDLAGAEAKSVIDATGHVVTPGFIDVHTHLDAQAFWDPTLSPSPLHGVTSVVGGNCGFSIAPLGKNPADGAYLMNMLSRVEGMPLESLETGVPWNWDTTEEYLALLDNTLAINAAFKVGHSAVRRVVMGADATKREATSDEIAQMCGLVRDAIEAGAIGFSSSWSTTHNDTEQRMVPSRYASREELLALCAVLADYPGTSLEFIPQVGIFTAESVELMAEMSRIANAPLNWNVLMVGASNREEVEAKLSASDFADVNGGKVRALTAPMALNFRLCFQSGFLLDAIPGWEETMLLPKAEKLAAFRDPAEVARLEAAAQAADYLRAVTNWSKMSIHHTVHPDNAKYTGRNIGEIASERGQSPWDALVEIALLDELQTSFGPPGTDEPDATWKARVEVWRDPRAVVGASDAGAHLDLFLTANYTTTLLGEAVVKRQLLPLEEAIHYLTAVPADLYGFVDRGRIKVGAFADLVVLDEHNVGSNETTFKSDLPAGGTRLYADARGIKSVICNGQEIVCDGEFTSARPGSILRTGVHTTANM